MTNTVTQSYNRQWQEKRHEAGRFLYQERVHATFTKLFTEILGQEFTGEILDLGCGDGSLVTLLNQKPGIHATGIDINPMGDQPGIDFENDALPFADETFDILIMYSVIEHIYNPGHILTEIRRILKPGGRIIVITPNFDLSHLFFCDRTFHHDPTHVTPYGKDRLGNLMDLYDFETEFMGLWTVGKSARLWKLPSLTQFYIGALLPFTGLTAWAPAFLKGRSKTILAVFRRD